MCHVFSQRKKWRVLKQSTRFASQPNYARSQRPSDINIHTFIRHFLLICNAFNCGNLEIKAAIKDAIIKRSSRVSYAKKNYAFRARKSSFYDTKTVSEL